MLELPTVETTPLAETQMDIEISGELDACSVNKQRLTTLEELTVHIQADTLGEIDGAFHCAMHETSPAGASVITLARDAIGHRTIFYARKPDGSLVHAQHVRTLIQQHKISARLDPRAIAAYLSCAYVPGRATLFAEVKELLPGHCLRYDGTSLTERPFFSIPSEGQPLSHAGEQQAIVDLRRVLEQTIVLSLDARSDQAAFLSGGIDSSVVVALVQRAFDRNVHTFSIAFGDHYKNELEWSSMVAKHVGTNHTVVHISPQEILAALDSTHADLALPIGDPLTVPNAILFARAREVSGYVWNGEGGDPCFGGPKNLPMVLAELYGDGENQAHHGSPRARSYYRAHLKCFDELEALMTPDALSVLQHDPLESDVDPFFTSERSFVGALSAINVTWKGGHHILPKVYQLAHAAGVKPRSPLFAKSVVEFASRLPSSMRLRGSVEKFALKEAVRDLLPSQIIERPKSGMMVPVEGWFQDSLLPQARERLLGGALPFDILRRATVENLLDGKQRGLRPRRGVKIWLLIALESYLRQISN
jgi:asparagine synthase (glutamine-hydrolysing)